MECPICGEDLPLNSRVCPACGNEVEQFFLTEAAEDSSVRKRVTDDARKAPRRKEPSALKVSKPIDRKRVGWIVAGCMVAIGVAAAVIFLVFGGKGPKSPQAAVESYYERLSAGDLEGMLSLFSSGYQPTGEQKKALSDEVTTKEYEVEGPAVHVLSNDGLNARVVLDELQVTVNDGGSEDRRSFARDVLGPLRESDPAARVEIGLIREDGEWKIADRPLNGWSPESIWVIGTASSGG